MGKINYGVFLNIHPSGKDKRVMLHKLPCNHYKQHLNKGKAKGTYTFHKDCRTFNEAIERASQWVLGWHAPIKVCKGCLGNWEYLKQ